MIPSGPTGSRPLPRISAILVQIHVVEPKRYGLAGRVRRKIGPIGMAGRSGSGCVSPRCPWCSGGQTSGSKTLDVGPGVQEMGCALRGFRRRPCVGGRAQQVELLVGGPQGRSAVERPCVPLRRSGGEPRGFPGPSLHQGGQAGGPWIRLAGGPSSGGGSLKKAEPGGWEETVCRSNSGRRWWSRDGGQEAGWASFVTPL